MYANNSLALDGLKQNVQGAVTYIEVRETQK
jgi:hypothetical protein